MHAMVTVRSSSTRLPEKCFLPLGKSDVLGHVIDRCRVFGFEPVVATTNESEDGAIVQRCAGLGVKCYAGPRRDKLLRWHQACEIFGIEKFVTVDCDDPFFDPSLSYISISRLNTFDVCYPSPVTYVGSVGSSFRAAVIKKACQEKSTDDTEMVWKHIKSISVSEDHKRKGDEIIGMNLDTHANEHERDIRLTLDYDEDYWLIRTVFRALGPLCCRHDILEFFGDNPGLTMVNAHRSAEWKRRQENG